MRGASHQGRSPHILLMNRDRVEKYWLCWPSVFVGTVSEKLLQECSPVLFLRRAGLVINTGVGGHAAALALTEVEFLNSCSQFLSHSHLQSWVQRSEQFPDLIKRLVITSSVPRCKDEHSPGQFANIHMGTAQVQECKINYFHQSCEI